MKFELEPIPGEQLNNTLIRAKALARAGKQVHFELYGVQFVVAKNSNLTAMWCLFVWKKGKKIGPQTACPPRYRTTVPPKWDRGSWEAIIKQLDDH